MTTKKRRRRITRVLLIYLALLPILIFLFGPILWNMSISFRATGEGFSEVPYLIPKEPTLEHYRYTFSKLGQFGILRYLGNSFFVAGATTLATLIVVTSASYALSRFRFRGNHAAQIWVLASQMLPPILLVIPLFILVQRIGLVNNYLGLIILYTTLTLPFCTWMLKGYFDAIPTEMEECAIVDGCTRLKALWYVVIPVIAPGLAAVGIFAFLLGYQEYLFALTMMKSQELQTVTVVLSTLSNTQYGTLWGPITAGALVIIVPVIIVFSFVQRFLVAGLTSGAVKA